MRQSKNPTLRRGLINENDGLDSFATESVEYFGSESEEIHEAHDQSALAEFEEVLPAVRVASVPPEPRRATRQAVVVVTPEVLPPAIIAPPPIWQRSWPSKRVTAIALAFFVVGVVGMWMTMTMQRDRSQASVVSVPSSAPSAKPVTSTPSVAAAPAPPAPVAAAPSVATVTPAEPTERPVAIAPTTRAVPTAPDVPRRAAVEPPAVPETPVTSEPDAPAIPAEPPAAVVAVDRPVSPPAEVVRAEPPPAAAEARAAIVTPPNDRASIERVLQQYREAYDKLDAPSAAVIWPRVDTRALSRAFSTLSSQDLSFDRCELAITGVKANAQCTGAIRYVRRVGDQEPRVRRMSWSFAFERVSDRWQIAQVTAD